MPIVGICSDPVISAPSVGGHGLEHDRERAGLLERERLVEDVVGRLASALHAVAAEPVHRLRREADVRHHGDADVDQPVDEVELRALDLHGVGAALLHAACRRCARRPRRGLVAT